MTMRFRTLWLLVGIAVLAVSLRPPFTTVGALLPDIAGDLGMSAGMMSVLTTLPLVCLGLFALAVPPLRQRWGDEGVIIVCLPLLVGGSLLWAGHGIAPLFAGTALFGAGVGMANVALPTIIKREFPTRVTMMTSLLSVFLTMGSSVPAAIAVPLMHAAGDNWQVPLMLPAALAILATLAWLPLLIRRRPRIKAVAPATLGLLRSPLARQVTAFMGLQSLIAFVVFGWLPSIAQDQGLSATTAGLVLSLATLMQVLGAMILPMLIGNRAEHRPMAVGLFTLMAVGILGIVLGPTSWIWVPAGLVGLCMGALLALALSMIGMRAGDAATTARLSSLAQAVGYLLAAAGPLLVGLLREVSGQWLLPMGFLLLVCLSGIIAGLGAGRPVLVDDGVSAAETAGSPLR